MLTGFGLGLNRYPSGAEKGVLSWVETLAWWDAGYGLSLDGASVTAWEDRKGGYSAAQATGASQPAYSATSFNGAPGLTFDGSDDHLTLDSMPFPSGADPLEAWLVVQQDALAAATGTRIAFGWGGSGNSRVAVGRNVVTAVNRDVASTATAGGAVAVQGVSVDLSSRHVIRYQVGATESILTSDQATPVAAAAVPTIGTTRVRIGSNTNDAVGGFWQGQIRDILVTSPLSTQKAAALTTFLLARRAL